VTNRLSEKARLALELSDEERINLILSERWFGYTKAKEILDKLDELFTYPKRHRMPNLLIVGDTNNGKTMIASRFQQLHPADENVDGDAIFFPVMLVQAPSAPDEGRFYNRILRKLSAPFKVKAPPDQKLFQVLTISERVNLKMLIIDEIQDILAGSLRNQHKLRNAIKQLGNELQIPIVGVGTQEAFHAIQTDPQLANRFVPVFLPRWEFEKGVEPKNNPYLKLLSSFESMLPLKEQSNLTESGIALKLLSMSEGLIGELSAILNEAAVKAIRSKKERINMKILNDIDFIPPSDRKWGKKRT
jgi:Bacterial TniB protein